jgi:hypothetical protein
MLYSFNAFSFSGLTYVTGNYKRIAGCFNSLMKKSLVLILSAAMTSAGATESLLNQGRSEIGFSELGIGYSSARGLLFSAQANYQYFLVNRFSLGGGAFYQNTGGREGRFEYMGIGPSANYYFLTAQSWLAGIGQDLMFSKYNGDRENVSFVTTTSSLGLNYLIAPNSAFGASFNYSHSLDGKRILQPFSLGVGFRIFL